jgi:hypothetical protein
LTCRFAPDSPIEIIGIHTTLAKRILLNRLKEADNMRRTVVLFFLPLLLLGCAATMQTGKIESSRISDVEGIIQSVSGKEVLLQLQLPDFKKESDDAIDEIARQVKQKAIIIEGIDVSVEGTTGSVKKVDGKTISVSFDKALPSPVGSTVTVKIPKKRIAIVDFTVIRGGIKEAGSIVMERLSTELIESGIFIVAERSKLQSIIEESKLIQSGLSGEDPGKFKPMLMIADIILTGTLSEVSNNYDINLRLLNVQTGQAISAFYVRAPLFKISDMRDSGEWNEDFETMITDFSWQIGPTTKVGYVSTDKTTGAEASNNSLRLDYDFRGLKSETEVGPGMINSKKRDISLFKGIEFYVKATEPIVGYINLDISDRDDPDVRTRWVTRYEIEKDWKKVQIPFDQLSAVRSKYITIAGYKPGKQILDLSHTEKILWGTSNILLRGKSEKGSMWIDKVRFYR